MADTTPDVSHTDRLSVCVRYVLNWKPIERLLGVVEAKDKTGLGIAKSIKEVLDKNQLDTHKIIYQYYDFASSMSGEIRGTQKMLSELIGHNIIFIPCQAHRANTFLEHSCEASSIIGNLMNDLEIRIFFWEYKAICSLQ